MNIQALLFHFLLKRKCKHFKFSPRKRIELVEFHVSEHCNLNCVSCTHFSPLAEPEFLDYETFERDIKQFAKVTKGNVVTMNILGGEPLLNKDLPQFLSVARRYFPDTNIQLVTNGILLNEQPDSFWQCCKENGIIVSMTKYPLKLPYDLIEKKAIDMGVSIKFFSAEKDNSSWHYKLDESGQQDKIYNFMYCHESNNCTNVYNGKLFICPIASNMHHFNKYFHKNIPIVKEDFLDIYKVKNLKQILKFIAKPTPICAYCNIKARTYNNKWRISKKELSEWM